MSKDVNDTSTEMSAGFWGVAKVIGGFSVLSIAAFFGTSSPVLVRTMNGDSLTAANGIAFWSVVAACAGAVALLRHSLQTTENEPNRSEAITPAIKLVAAP